MSTESFDSPIRVIVASGSRPLRELLRRSLVQDGRLDVVGEASDGDGVVAQRDSFDVALVDLSIPGLGVLGVLSKIRDGRPAASVVVMAHTDAVYLRSAVTAEGGADYIVIPDDLEQLADRLFKAVQPGIRVAS